MIEPEIPSSSQTPPVGGVPPPMTSPGPSLIGTPAPLVAASPPPLPTNQNRKSSGVRALLALLLSLCLGLFLADAIS